jgi:predicted nucleic acid-binding protein
MAPILIDTNLLVYLHDFNESQKQAQAQQVLDQLRQVQSGRLSVQCLAEFFSVATRKLSPALTPAQALQQVELFARLFPTLSLTPQIVFEAGRGARDYQLSYYDAQLWATAQLNQIPIIFSEDFSSDTALEAVAFVNPFATDFAIESWL